MEEISSDINDQLDNGIEKYVSVSLALDESTDIGSTAQLLIFIRGVTENFQISKELFAMVSLKDRTTEARIYVTQRLLLLIKVTCNGLS